MCQALRMGAGNHTGHRVRGRYRDAEQISRAVTRLRRDQFLVVECGAAEQCYAQVRLTLQGVYDVEFRDGTPGEYYRTRTQSPPKAAAALTAWAGAEPGWSDGFDWSCIGSQFTSQELVPGEPPEIVPEPPAHAVAGAKGRGRAPIYHIASSAQWQAARETGEYRISTGNSPLEEHGYIHACFADQVESIANSILAPAHEPPVVLVINEDALPGPVRVESSPDAENFFPRIYGPLPVGAVSNVLDLDRGTGIRWHWPHTEDWQHPVPHRIPIAREANYRTDLIGRYADGLFLAGFCRTTYLHLFDRHGAHRWSWIAPAEHAHPEDVSTRILMDHLRGLISHLPDPVFGDIAIEPFAVLDTAGERWGLFDETVEYGFPHAELRPDRLGFNPPWNGEYDT